MNPTTDHYGTILTDEEWAEQPAELKALGRVAGEKALFEWMNSVFLEVRAEIDAKHATMTSEEIAASERQASEELEEIVSADNDATFGPTRSRQKKGLGRN